MSRRRVWWEVRHHRSARAGTGEQKARACVEATVPAMLGHVYPSGHGVQMPGDAPPQLVRCSPAGQVAQELQAVSHEPTNVLYVCIGHGSHVPPDIPFLFRGQ